MKSTKQIFILSALAFSAAILLGCATNAEYFKTYYSGEPVGTFAQSDYFDIKIHDYYLGDDYQMTFIDDVYNTFYSDAFDIIGVSGFNTSDYQDASDAKNFCQELGAEVMLAEKKFTNSETYQYESLVPHTSYTNVYSGNKYIGRTTTTSYTTETNTGTRKYYDYKAYFLKRIRDVKCPGDFTRSDVNFVEDYGEFLNSASSKIEFGLTDDDKWMGFIKSTDDDNGKIVFYSTNDVALKWVGDDFKPYFSYVNYYSDHGSVVAGGTVYSKYIFAKVADMKLSINKNFLGKYKLTNVTSDIEIMQSDDGLLFGITPKADTGYSSTGKKIYKVVFVYNPETGNGTINDDGELYIAKFEKGKYGNLKITHGSVSLALTMKQ